MKPKSRISRAAIGVALCLALAACQSDDDRAQHHFERAMALMEEGDLERARVEFLNVFQNDGLHRDARAELAAMLREMGRTSDSYSQYLRLIEQYPEDVEGRIALAEMAIQFQNWDDARRHGEAAMELAPEDPRLAVITVSLAYSGSISDGDDLALEAATAEAEALLAEDPRNALLLRLGIDSAIRDGAFDTALQQLDAVIEQEPENRLFYDIKLSLLAEREQMEAVETHLLTMLEVFAGDENLPGTLLRFYLATARTDDALAFLRSQAEAAEDGQTWADAMTALVQLQLELGGSEVALAELDEIIATAAEDETRSDVTFLALRGSLQFEGGDTEAGIATLQALVERDDLGFTELADLQVVLAQMLLRTGNEVGARAQVEQVLEVDARQAEALKMRAAWLIDEDEGDRAIAALRTALDSSPGDVAALSLMAQAYTRNGNRQLAREFLALAVEASNSAPAETLRFVDVLMAEERYLPAEELLLDALRLAPGEISLMAKLGELYIAMEDWPRTEQVEMGLREDGGEDRLRLAAGLQATRLAAQGRLEDAVGLVEEMAAAAGTGDHRAQIAVIQARLGSGDSAAALSYAQDLVEGAPDSVPYQLALAAVYSAMGDVANAEASFRALTQSNPQLQQGWLGLIREQNAQGRAEAAEETLAAALEALPDAMDLLWVQASLNEQNGDIDGAIAIYELMYERAPGADVVANNLASLLSTYREDDASLERAWTVARRLRGLESAPFQDTYGWIAYRRGDYDEALSHLEAAAQGLPEDPMVQYHLAMTYAVVVGRRADAVAQFQRALALAGDDPRPQFDTARSELARLEAELENEEAEQ